MTLPADGSLTVFKEFIYMGREKPAELRFMDAIGVIGGFAFILMCIGQLIMSPISLFLIKQ